MTPVSHTTKEKEATAQIEELLKLLTTFDVEGKKLLQKQPLVSHNTTEGEGSLGKIDKSEISQYTGSRWTGDPVHLYSNPVPEESKRPWRFSKGEYIFPSEEYIPPIGEGGADRGGENSLKENDRKILIPLKFAEHIWICKYGAGGIEREHLNDDRNWSSLDDEQSVYGLFIKKEEEGEDKEERINKIIKDYLTTKKNYIDNDYIPDIRNYNYNIDIKKILEYFIGTNGDYLGVYYETQKGRGFDAWNEAVGGSQNISYVMLLTHSLKKYVAENLNIGDLFYRFRNQGEEMNYQESIFYNSYIERYIYSTTQARDQPEAGLDPTRAAEVVGIYNSTEDHNKDYTDKWDIRAFTENNENEGLVSPERLNQLKESGSLSDNPRDVIKIRGNDSISPNMPLIPHKRESDINSNEYTAIKMWVSELYSLYSVLTNVCRGIISGSNNLLLRHLDSNIKLSNENKELYIQQYGTFIKYLYGFIKHCSDMVPLKYIVKDETIHSNLIHFNKIIMSSIDSSHANLDLYKKYISSSILIEETLQKYKSVYRGECRIFNLYHLIGKNIPITKQHIPYFDWGDRAGGAEVIAADDLKTRIDGGRINPKYSLSFFEDQLNIVIEGYDEDKLCRIPIGTINTKDIFHTFTATTTNFLVADSFTDIRYCTGLEDDDRVGIIPIKVIYEYKGFSGSNSAYIGGGFGMESESELLIIPGTHIEIEDIKLKGNIPLEVLNNNQRVRELAPRDLYLTVHCKWVGGDDS